MKHWKLGIALACLFAVPIVWAGQVPNPVNAPASVTSGDIAYWSGTSPQNNFADSGHAFGTSGASLCLLNANCIWSTTDTLTFPDSTTWTSSGHSHVIDAGNLSCNAAYQAVQTNGSGQQNCATLESRQILMTTTNFTQAQNTTCYYGWGAFPTACGAGAGNAREYAPLAGTFRKLFCSVSAAPGTGNSVACTLYINAAAPGSGPTCTISNAATTCTDNTDTATIAIGGYSNVQAVASASLASSVSFYASIEFDNP